MSFSPAEIIRERQADQCELHRRYLSPGLARVQGIIGFDKIWAKEEGAYLWDTDSERYLDLPSRYHHQVLPLGVG